MIGDRIRTLRESRGWTQAHLAEVAGVSERTIQRVETQHSYSGETAMALASALNVEAQDLVAPNAAAAGEHRPLWPAPKPHGAAAPVAGILVVVAALIRVHGSVERGSLT